MAGAEVNQLFAIAAGGALGAVMRFGVSNAVYAWLGRGFPWGTLAVNVLGSLAMGFLYVLMIDRLAVGGEWRAFVLVGLLGAFTTFSTFSIETLTLIQDALYGRALANMLVSVLACVVAAFAGVVLARQVT
ncbi:MAG: fluoride efflux transporter CrcB [Gammaproteobacteria bacterium]|nr:MAG: fluoride efflux transporter CrcB [Gammaproteobacteria bacterium]